MPAPARPDRELVAFLLRWHGVWQRRAGREGLRQALRQLQGVSLPFSDLEFAILRARIRDYSPLQLDGLISGGEFVWQGDQALGQHDGYISVFELGDFPLLGRICAFVDGEREQQLRNLLLEEDGLDFAAVNERLGGFRDDLLRSLWRLVWRGEVSSDSLDALRARRSSTASRHRRRPRPRYSTPEGIPPGAVGRWTLLSGPAFGFAPESDRKLAHARQLLVRWGIVSRRSVAGFDDLRPLLEELEAQGLASRTQLSAPAGDEEFSAPGAGEVWRLSRDDHARVELSAVDPANAFGALVPWPVMAKAYSPQRSPGARLFIDDGRLVGYMTRTGRRIHTPAGLEDPAPLLQLLRQAALRGPVFLESVDGEGPYETPWHHALVDAGFSPSARGYLLRAAG